MCIFCILSGSAYYPKCWMLLLTDLNRNTHTVALFSLLSYKKVLEKILCFPSQAPNTDGKDPGSEVAEDPVRTTPRSEGTSRTDYSRAPRSHDFASWQHEGFCKSHPEPFFGARIGVIANCNEPQDTWKLVLHGFALDWNEPFETSPWKTGHTGRGLHRATVKSRIHFLPTAAHTSQDPGLLLILYHLIIMQLAVMLESKFLNPKPTAKNISLKWVAGPHPACAGQLALMGVIKA